MPGCAARRALREKMADALTPGFPVELDPDEAERVGAFVEDVLTEKEEQEDRPCRDRRSVGSLAPPGVRPCRAHQTRPGITPAFLPLRRPFSVPYQQAHERDGQLLQAS